MLGGNRLKLAGLAMLLIITPLLNNCAWREGPPCSDTVIRDGGTTSRDTGGGTIVTGGSYDDAALRDKIADLERRLAANERAADSALNMAERALKCCRQDLQILATDHIYFNFNKSDIRADARVVLDRVGARLKADPDLIAELSGFADAVGSDDYNVALGQRRADAARSYLVSAHGINAGRLATKSFGESAAVHPPTASEEVREADRRVTIDILGYEK